MVVDLGFVSLSGIGLGAISGMLLNLVLPRSAPTADGCKSGSR